MVVRIRLSRGPSRRTLKAGVQGTALICAALLTPAALMSSALAAWRLMADMNWAGEFVIRDGFFSHWQVWVAISIGVQFIAFVLGRTGREEPTHAPTPIGRRAAAGGR